MPESRALRHQIPVEARHDISPAIGVLCFREPISDTADGIGIPIPELESVALTEGMVVAGMLCRPHKVRVRIGEKGQVAREDQQP
jgi:hypothetical protein